MSARFRRFLPILALTMTAANAPDSPSPARGAAFNIRWSAAGASAPESVDVAGIDAENLAELARVNWDSARWNSLFHVSVVPAGTANKDFPPIAGTYRVVGDRLRFIPRFPMEPGLLHRASFRPSRLPHAAPGPPASDILGEHTRPLPPPPPATFVVRADPGGDRLPENLLKFYLHFSAPMSRGEAYSRIRLLDASGRPRDRAFLELGEELWDPSGTRLTLLLDPGRIKRGLKPREDLGPILESGRAYTLVVDREWPDAAGYPLRESYRKAFRAGTADETQPDPKTWKVEAPRAGTRDALVLVFPEPLDRALLERVLNVKGPDGSFLTGAIEVGDRETRWSFRPAQPWRSGTVQVVVDTTLEDLAGNNIARPFEVDVLRPVTERVEAETVTIPVVIAPR